MQRNTLPWLAMLLPLLAAAGSAHAQNQKFDNIIIHKVTTNKYPQYRAYLAKLLEKICESGGTPLKGGPFDADYGRKSLLIKETTYLSGRTQVVYRESYNWSKGDCDATLKPQRSVTFGSPTKKWKASLSIEGVPKFEDTSPAPTPETKAMMDDIAAFHLRRAAKARKKAATRNYASRETHFGHECGYTGGIGAELGMEFCQLIASPVHEGTGTNLRLSYRNTRKPHFEGQPVDCTRPPEENVALFGYQVTRVCILNGVEVIYERFEVNATIPKDVFEIPDFARDVARTTPAKVFK
ncbi:MAG: hypothetical protein LBP52_04570 [Burkholderiaceae bacterium]|nr:hypothetical protein [Burkholderiaceae bacterium]